ncbi:hypothetical protein WMF45_41585 [Sorangium sp. So ce448]|uniref:hypothetical protein n=1 Tax=Sorangium sp. So ce448 TaxID=3133314 RepID=UPI003F64851F
MKDEDRDERGEREAEGGAASEPDAGAPASPAPTPSQLVSHPAFRTGVLYIEPELRDEVEAYWKAYAVWERTKQGPPPREPRVNVRVDHEEKPSTAARLREAMAPRKGAAKRGGGKSGAEKSGGGSPWAADAAAAAAVIDKNALPSAHRPRSEAAEEKDGGETDARPGMVRRAGTVAAMLALAAGIGAAAMCGVKEKAPVESAVARDAASAERAMREAAASGAAASGAAVTGSDERAESAPLAVEEIAAEGAPPEASAERAAPAVISDRGEAAPAARRRPAPAVHAPAPRVPERQPPTRQPSPVRTADTPPPAPVTPAPPATASTEAPSLAPAASVNASRDPSAIRAFHTEPKF